MGTDLAQKRRETASNACDMAETMGRRTATDLHHIGPREQRKTPGA
jgi:hypothetical protein